MPSYINGFGGDATFASTTYPVESWSLAINAEALDTTNTADAGWETNITGAKVGEGTVKMFVDTAALPTAQLQAGSSGTLTLKIGSTVKQFSVPCRITNVTMENPVKGVVNYSVSVKSNGAITIPT